ncbi:sulfotransferase family 2 domain-containing protein [Microbulbifer epialgicus]|uniref:Sulfotransferase family 2 domain-containing protein n=1 Tax=Microbulbifer epialgicus TaxID=393907 RepID=A0ABV4P3S3_9GAMM
MVKPIVFVHIPKTAGTSFRWGADSFFGKENVCRDYGKKSLETSVIVRDWLSSEKDGWIFEREFIRQGYQFLTGHFNAAKYIDIFDAGRVITFLRDPIQRIVSEYNHIVRNTGNEVSFESFYRNPEYINRQLRLVGRRTWTEFGFIGFVDAYQESLSLLNRKFNIEIPYLHKNIAKSERVEPQLLSAEQLLELRSLNAEELDFYDRARIQFNWRIRLANADQSFVCGCVTKFEAGRLKGWAVSEDVDEAVLVQLRVGKRVVAECKANEYRPYCKARGLGRGGFVGFSLEVCDVVGPDDVECVVASTGQPLPFVDFDWTLPSI